MAGLSFQRSHEEASETPVLTELLRTLQVFMTLDTATKQTLMSNTFISQSENACDTFQLNVSPQMIQQSVSHLNIFVFVLSLQ